MGLDAPDDEIITIQIFSCVVNFITRYYVPSSMKHPFPRPQPECASLVS